MTIKTDIKWKKLLINIIIPLAVGGISSIISMSGYENYSDKIIKPSLSPPAWLFPVVWTILYIVMGISSYIVWERDASKDKKAFAIYAIQLFLNFMWSIFFFNLGAYLFSFIWLIILWGFVIAMIISFYRIDKTAGLLQIPYLLWLSFAAYLNLAVYLMN